MGRGCRTAGDLLGAPGLLADALLQLHVADPEGRASNILDQCRLEVLGAKVNVASAYDIAREAEAGPSVDLPCTRLGELLQGALQPGASILELCGLPGSGKTQVSMQLCAAVQCTGLSE